jgi:S1-C subfamily serine protease
LAVLAGSSADQAGIKVGDIILSVNGDEVNPDQNLAQLISEYKPGDMVSLKIVRDGKEIEVKVSLN